jgi:hypothetical protein
MEARLDVGLRDTGNSTLLSCSVQSHNVDRRLPTRAQAVSRAEPARR